YTPAEIVGQKITALMPESMRHRHEEAMRRYLETGEKRISWNAVSLLGLHKNGREINLDVSFAEVGTGDERFFSGIVRDVTERKRTEEALQKTQAELAHVTRVATLGEMTASIAHEINQPLAAVVNNASACLRWLAAHNLEEARQSAALVVADGHRAGEIVARIRALVKKAPPRKDWLGINDTIHEVIALVRSEVQRKGIALETTFSDDVHSVPLILADRIQVQQVLLNLIINAIEAMSGAGDGPQELLVRSGTDELQHVLVAVRDSGPGLDPQSLERLFDAFYTTKPHGLGMGLAISRSIIEAHGGRLWATANEGRGATFQFTLPTGGERASWAKQMAWYSSSMMMSRCVVRWRTSFGRWGCGSRSSRRRRSSCAANVRMCPAAWSLMCGYRALAGLICRSVWPRPTAKFPSSSSLG